MGLQMLGHVLEQVVGIVVQVEQELVKVPKRMLTQVLRIVMGQGLRQGLQQIMEQANRVRGGLGNQMLLKT